MGLSKMFSHNKEKTYATGVVNPKTTALFFDKLWVPDEEAILFSIPKSIRLPNLNISDDEYVHFGKLNNSSLYRKAVVSNFGVPSEEVFRSAEIRNSIASIDEIYQINLRHNQSVRYFGPSEINLRAAYTSMVEQYLERDGFLTSFNRNEALRIISNYYQRHGLPLIPIFLSKTDFEKSLLMSGPQNETGLPDGYFENVYSKIVRERNVDAIEATINSISIIVEDNLTWEQVKEIRKDKESIKKLRKFRLWASTDFKDKSETEVSAIIAKSLEEYEYALRKHGIMTAVGAMTTVLSSASSIVGAIESSQAGLIAAGLSVSAGLVTYSAQQLYEYFDTKRQPIAYIYDITKQAL